MKRPPFLMRASRGATLRRDGKFLVGGRASFVWETFLKSRAAGVPGDYEIRASDRQPWHRLDWTIEEAEEMLATWGMFGAKRVKQMQAFRARRVDRGLPVA